MNSTLRPILAGLLFLCMATAAKADVRLPAIFSDGAVLQRLKPIKIWGWAAPHEPVVLRLADQVEQTEAGADGRWSLRLRPMEAGGPYRMVVRGRNEVRVSNVLIGDVWICAGQSNMEMRMRKVSERYAQVIREAKHSQIRQFTVAGRYNFNQPEEDVPAASWQEADSVTILDFSAVAYFFAQRVASKLNIPIGIINASSGGTPIEAWASEEALAAFPYFADSLAKFKDAGFVASVQERSARTVGQWHSLAHKLDSGLRPGGLPWYATGYDASAWPRLRMPGYWEEAGLKNLDGVVWFRKEVYLDTGFCGKPTRLLLGSMADADSTYVNGVLVGFTGQRGAARAYAVPPVVLTEGKNIITVRLVNTANNGGFVKDKPYRLVAGKRSIDLQGDWSYRIGAAMSALPQQTNLRYVPAGLYNGMIAPLVNYNIKGFLWYQGEANVGKAQEYSKLFPALIADWRTKFYDRDLPFLFVQLPNFQQVKSEPSESRLAAFREAQAQALALPCTAMAVTTDLGEWNDIHPANKKDVGERLALLAFEKVYQLNITGSGPVYQQLRITGSTALVTFKNAAGGLTIKEGSQLKIAIAGADRKFVWAFYQVKGNRLKVWHPSVAAPVAVRYAWADNPEGFVLANSAGLPAAPFRTDNW